jgi:hypothetical protein
MFNPYSDLPWLFRARVNGFQGKMWRVGYKTHNLYLNFTEPFQLIAYHSYC